LLHAIDINGKRVYPQRGIEAYCPICHEQVGAYCGEIYIDHWQHKIYSDCDPWHEQETDWHRDWKNEFPENWQEVVLTRKNDVHRADVMTSSGLVVEFQNSFISAGEIRERERFYQKMIWVINANAFKGNFRIQSLVNFYLRLNESDNYQLSDPDYEPLKKNIKEIEEKISDIQYDINLKYSEIKSFTAKAENLEKSVKDFLSNFASVKGIAIKTEYHKFRSDNNENNIEIEKCNEKLKYIEGLEKCTLSGLENYRFVDFTCINPKDFNKCKIIETSTRRTLIPIIFEIKNEQGFLNYKHYSNMYSLIANVNLSIDFLQKDIAAKKHDNKNLQKEIARIEIETSNALDLEYTLKIEALEEELNGMLDKLGDLQMKLSYENSQYLKEVNNINEKRSKDLEAIQKQKEQSKINIMKQYKGYYSYSWKHRRKSWDFTTKNVFLDFGSHLFAIIDGETLKKVERNNLIQQIKDNIFH
jgi:competence CoiA-like predicted nuclease